MPQGGECGSPTSLIDIAAESPQWRGLPAGTVRANSGTDSGQGMDAPTLARIFDTIFHAPSARRRNRLGLAIVPHHRRQAHRPRRAKSERDELRDPASRPAKKPLPAGEPPETAAVNEAARTAAAGR